MKEHFTVLNEEVNESSAVIIRPQEYEDVPDGVGEGNCTVQLEEDNTTEEEKASDSNLV